MKTTSSTKISINFKKIILASCSLYFLANNCYAEAYINFNTGIASFEKLPKPAWSNTINAGYSFFKGFAVEGGYAVLTSTQYDTANVYTGLFDVAAKGTIPLSSIFQLYGRLGTGMGLNGWTGTSYSCNQLCSSNNTSYGFLLISGGANFTISKHFDLRLEDVVYTPMTNLTYTGNINSVNFGFEYNF